MDPKEIVRRGYDRISEAYRGDDEEPDGYVDWLTELADGLPAGAQVLDLGCGNGVPVARWLSEHGFAVHGVDISERQIERARALVPGATFEVSDMSALTLEPGSLDAVVALYSIIHVPLEEQPDLFLRIAQALRPGGRALMIVGTDGWTGTEEDWLGAKMYWSTADLDTYRGWFADAGLAVLWTRFIPEGDGGATLVLAARA